MQLVTLAEIRAAAERLEGVAVHTPMLHSRYFSALAGAPVFLKAECLQITGSFKLRGALSKLAALGDGLAAGVVTASAGNHARSLAHDDGAAGKIAEAPGALVQEHRQYADAVDAGQPVHDPHKVADHRVNRANGVPIFANDAYADETLARRLPAPQDLEQHEIAGCHQEDCQREQPDE